MPLIPRLLLALAAGTAVWAFGTALLDDDVELWTVGHWASGSLSALIVLAVGFWWRREAPLDRGT